MRHVIFGVVLWSTLYAQSGVPVVSHVRADAVGHSSLRLIWDNNSEINAIRVRYGFTSAYEQGSGGAVFRPGTALFSQFGQTLSISGLAPGQVYHFCPQSSVDGGTSWSACTDFTATTLPLPAAHPEPPEAPAEVDLDFPPQTGATVTIASDCSDLQERMNQARYGDTLLIPAGVTCSGRYTLPPAPEAVYFNSSDIDPVEQRISLPQHPFAQGQKVHLDTEGCLPGSAGPDPFCQLRGVLPGSDYFIQRIDDNTVRLTDSNGEPVSFAAATFTVDIVQGTLLLTPGATVLRDGTPIQVRSSGDLPVGLLLHQTYYVLNPSNTRTLRLALSPGGPPVPLSSAGSGTQSLIDPGWGRHAIMAWPPANNGWIVVRTATPDDQFCPEGVRCLGSIWASKMARIAKLDPPTGDTNDLRLQNGLLSHHWRFIGIEFTHGDNSAAAQTSTDPTPYFGFFSIRRTASHIVFDRCYIHGLGFPNRIYRAIMNLDGEHVAIVNSDLEKLDYWHPLATPGNAFLPEIQSSPRTIRIAPGTYNMGTATASLASPVSVTLTSGSGDGIALAYFTLEGKLEILLPAGFSGTCTGAPSCRVITSSSGTPSYPTTPEGRISVAQIGDLTISSGAFTAVQYRAGLPRSINAVEGAQSLIAGNGPGPVLLANNTISATGLPVHFDDSGSSVYDRHDYIVRRNLFTAPWSQMAGGPDSDGLHYFHRNMLEWKGGQRILIEGNIFENNFSDVLPLGPALVITPRSGGTVTDVMIRSNTFRNNVGSMMLAAVDSYSPISKPMERVAVVNNLFHHNDGYRYVSPVMRSSATGIQIYYGYAAADFRMDHNTFFDNRGWDPVFLHLAVNPIEGVSITNNFLWINDDAGRGGIEGESYPGCAVSGRRLLDCALLAGAGNPAYKFENNVLFPGWTSSLSRTSLVDPGTLRNAYSGLVDTVLEGNTIEDRLFQAGYSALAQAGLDFRLSLDSPFASGGAQSGNDSRQIGANMDELEVEQGQMGPAQVLETGVGFARIWVTVPDPGAACYVLFGKGEDVAGFDRTPANRDNSRVRLFRVEVPQPGSYNYTVLCSGASNASSGTFATPQARRR